MAVWDKSEIEFEIVDSSTGSPDTTAHTVKMCPVDGTYPTDATDCSQKSVVTSMWGPDSDLDDQKNYAIWVNGSLVKSYPSKKANPATVF